ncbi:MAG: hypothetical protein M3R63_20490, partial [Actinomycetota bacterium]|nr:hypothetical protein [Actinomycetota bacterium]
MRALPDNHARTPLTTGAETHFGHLPQSGRLFRSAGGPRWALSVLDVKAHAVDENDDHPLGVFIAACRHRLLRGGLHDEPPGGLCTGCGHAVVARRVEGRPVRWARSPGDSRCHAVAHREAAPVTVTDRTQA